MKKIAFGLLFLLSIRYMTSCTWFVRHSDPFYNYNDNDFPREHLPLSNPIEATRKNSSSPWRLNLMPYAPSVPVPNSQDVYVYGNVSPLEKFSVKNGVVLAYSSDVDTQADPYIQDNFYHWFVIIPNKKGGVVGFHTEDEFIQYIQTLGIQNPDWQTPDEAFKTFAETGCLEWIPDCN